MRGKKHSRAAIAAKQLRQELKKKFPKTNFKVRGQVFDQGDAIRVSWWDGPLVSNVDKIAQKYSEGEYDTDKGEYVVLTKRKGIPQVNAVTTCRLMTNSTEDVIVELLHAKYPNDCGGKDRDAFIPRFNAAMRQLMWEEFHRMDLYNR
jgi:hypothetical protein